MRNRIQGVLIGLGLLSLGPAVVYADAPSAEIAVDRVVVRFSAPEAGGVEKPHYVLGRELGFEARLVGLADRARPRGAQGYEAQDVEVALSRHIAETLIADLTIDPEPSAAESRDRAKKAQQLAEQELGGASFLETARTLEGLSRLEVQRIFRRRARASLYLDRMVAPMLRPTLLELRRIHQRGSTPFSSAPFESIQDPLRDWYVETRLREAVLNYYQNARTRLRIDYFG